MDGQVPGPVEDHLAICRLGRGLVGGLVEEPVGGSSLHTCGVNMGIHPSVIRLGCYHIVIPTLGGGKYGLSMEKNVLRYRTTWMDEIRLLPRMDWQVSHRTISNSRMADDKRLNATVS